MTNAACSHGEARIALKVWVLIFAFLVVTGEGGQSKGADNWQYLEDALEALSPPSGTSVRTSALRPSPSTAGRETLETTLFPEQV